MSISFDTPADTTEFRHFRRAATGSFDFRVRASQSACLCLATGPTANDQLYEVVIGDRNNTVTAIIGQHEVRTPVILSATEYRGFWIRYADRTVKVGRDMEAEPFMQYVVDRPLSAITHVGFRTGGNAAGSWSVAIPYQPPGPTPPEAQQPCRIRWEAASCGAVPAGAVAGGRDGGKVQYVARARHCGGLLPGKLVVQLRATYVAWRGREHKHCKYEVLTTTGCRLEWVETRDGRAVTEAVVGGYTEQGETLYVGRVNYDGCLTLGKVQRSHGICYVPYNGEELKFARYEVLVAK